MTEEETLHKFPCEFSIKSMGLAESDFDALVVGLIRPHVPDLCESAVKTRPSKNGKYLAVTVTITATSKAQLDAIYQDLTDHEKILMSL